MSDSDAGSILSAFLVVSCFFAALVMAYQVGKHNRDDVTTVLKPKIQWVPASEWEGRTTAGEVRWIEFGFKADGGLMWRAVE